MKRCLVRCLFAGIVGLASVAVSPAQEGQTPGGYQFFSRRNRTTPTTWSRVAEPSAAKSARKQAPCCKTAEDIQAPSPPAIVTETAPATAEPDVRQVTWGTEFGLGYGWPEEGYYPGAQTYAFGKTIPYPLHGYRATYDWAGHTYTMHCYCAKGYCPYHCPGYRGECFVPCWNDNGTPIFERRCGRGSCFDAFWHMGGYECRRRKTDCPYVCNGPPAYYSYGFPHGMPGDPNYVQKRSEAGTPPWPMTHGPYGPTPATKPLPAPANPPVAPNPNLNPAEPPIPSPQP